VAIDAADMLSAAVEAYDRRELSDDLTGGAVFSAAGLATAWAALSVQP